MKYKLVIKEKVKEIITESNTKDHFHRELDILQKDGELLIDPFIDLIEEIIERFDEEGHSGMSAPYGAGALADTIKRALLFEPLSPIQNTDDEWNDIAQEGDGGSGFQNNRRSAIFKESKDSTPYYLDAIIWQGEDEYDTFGGTVGGISSRQFIKEFPFEPKTFYIDVKKVFFENVTDADDYFIDNNDRYYDYEIVDRSQLEEVKELYDVDRSVLGEKEVYEESFSSLVDIITESVMSLITEGESKLLIADDEDTTEEVNKIKIDPYVPYLRIFVNCTTEELNQKLEVDLEHEYDAVTFWDNENNLCVAFFGDITNDLVVHESVHIANKILWYSGVESDFANDEAQAHLIDNIFDIITESIKSYNDNITESVMNLITEDEKKDIVITIPKSIKWEDYEKELENASKGEILNFKVNSFPKTDIGNKCYVCHDGYVKGYHIISGLSEKEFDCTTTGKSWKGKFVERTGNFNEVESIEMKGFQGFRYFNG